MKVLIKVTRRLVFSTILVLLTFAAGAVDIDKVIEKEYEISASGTVDLKNRFGSVVVSESSSNKVKIKITIDAKTNSQSKADEIFKRVDITFSNSSDYVSAMTEIEEESGWSSWFSWGSSTDFQINYEVSMPTSAHLKVENKYGDIKLPDLNNGLDIENKYGNIVMRSVEGSTDLELGYGKIDFGDIGDLTADIKHSEVRGNSAKEVKIESKYSKFKVKSVETLRSDTKYDIYEIVKAQEIKNSGKSDKWSIQEVTDFSSSTKYTPIKIEKLYGELRVDQKYGNIKVDEVACTSEKIDLDVEYTDVELGLGNCGCEMNFAGEYVTLRLPDDMLDAVEEDGEDSWLKGKFGDGERRMKLEMEHGKLKIR